MRVLIDTCVLLWGMLDPARLSPDAAAILRDPGHSILISVVSAWEISIKQTNGKLTLADSTVDFMAHAASVFGTAFLPVGLTHAILAGELPVHHRDPFDRMLIAQAIIEKVPLISPDIHFAAYPIHRLW